MSIIWSILLVLLCLIFWASNLLGLPGNWCVIGAAAVYAYLLPSAQTREIGAGVFIGLLVLAVLGEIVEFLAGAAGARKAGGSTRAAVIALIGSMVGGTLGVFVGVPVPVLGPVIAAVFFAGAGAFIGAVLGEAWKGRSLNDQVTVGKAAFWGRLLGTVGKLAAGAVMIVLVAVSLIY